MTRSPLPAVLLAGFLIPFVNGCSDSEKDTNAMAGAGFADVPVVDAPRVGRSTHGMVSSAHPLATRAGQSMLVRGGSAADAAVAVGFALAVVEGSMNGLGGRAQILVDAPDVGEVGIDAQTQLTAGYRQPWIMPQMEGYTAVGIPGMPAGLLELHQRFGRLPLADVLAPAIGYAGDGFELLPGETSRQSRVEESIRNHPVLAGVYLNDAGELREAGDVFVQRELAATLSSIAAGGADAFYRGEIARRMATDVTANGGSLSVEDLAAYRPRPARLVRTDYRGYEVISLAAPGNGTSVIESLNILSGYDVGRMSEPAWAVLLSQTLALALTDTMLDDPDDDRVETTTSQAWADERRSAIRLPMTSARLDATRVKPDEDQVRRMRLAQVDYAGEGNGRYSHHTTHYVVTDGEMAVSVTQTVGPNMGARVMTEGLGFLYAQTGGIPRLFARQSGGDRPRTNIAPTIVKKDGQVVLVLGAAGGTLIPPAIVQVISRMIDQGMTLEDAVAAPRVSPTFNFLPFPGFDEQAVEFEATPINGWDDAMIEDVTGQGFETVGKSRYALFGRVHAIEYRDGHWHGVADPDWEGHSLGVARQVPGNP